MSKSTKITLIFVLIFVIGILVLITHINHSLNNPRISNLDFPDEDPYQYFPRN